MPKLTMTLGVVKTTDNKVVFKEVKDANDPFAVVRVSGIYLDNRDLRDIGWSRENPRLRVTFEPIDK